MPKSTIIRTGDVCQHADKDANGFLVFNVKRPRRVVVVRAPQGHLNEARDKALQDAAKLAEGLGSQWEGYAWENMGWRYSAKLGHCEVLPHSRTGYWANLTSKDIPQVCCTGRTSAEAVKGVVREAILMSARLDEAVDLLRAK